MLNTNMTYQYIGTTKYISTSPDPHPLGSFISVEKNELYELTISQNSEIKNEITVKVYYGDHFLGYLYYETAIHFFECWKLAYN